MEENSRKQTICRILLPTVYVFLYIKIIDIVICSNEWGDFGISSCLFRININVS